jgi:hypothetical protein
MEVFTVKPIRQEHMSRKISITFRNSIIFANLFPTRLEYKISEILSVYD